MAWHSLPHFTLQWNIINVVLMADVIHLRSWIYFRSFARKRKKDVKVNTLRDAHQELFAFISHSRRFPRTVKIVLVTHPVTNAPTG